MLSLYRAWLGPGPCGARPQPPPGALRPVPRRARAPSPPTPRAASPSSTTSSELDVERIEPEASDPKRPVLDVASCDGPVRFSRVLNAAWRDPTPERCWPRKSRPVQSYPCKTCGSKFPSYYFVHKHRKRCHAEEVGVNLAAEPEPSTSSGVN